VSGAEDPVEVESVELLDVHFRVSADAVHKPRPIGAVVIVQSTPPRHPLDPVHRACTVQSATEHRSSSVTRATPFERSILSIE